VPELSGFNPISSFSGVAWRPGQIPRASGFRHCRCRTDRQLWALSGRSSFTAVLRVLRTIGLSAVNDGFGPVPVATVGVTCGLYLSPAAPGLKPPSELDSLGTAGAARKPVSLLPGELDAPVQRSIPNEYLSSFPAVAIRHFNISTLAQPRVISNPQIRFGRAWPR